MKRRLFCLLLGLFGGGIFGTSFEAYAETSRPRILVVTGGHGFDEKAFFAMLDSFSEISYTHVRFPEAWSQLKPGLEEQYDVLLLYDMYQAELTEAQKTGFEQLFEAGIGVFALHHAICSHVRWEKYYDMLGGRIFYEGQNVFRGEARSVSTFVDGQDIPIFVADSSHPVSRGIHDFTIRDEAYGKILVHPEVHVLLRSNHPLQTPQTAWLWKYGKSPVLVNLLGHDAVSYAHPEFRRWVLQGILYLASSSSSSSASSSR